MEFNSTIIGSMLWVTNKDTTEQIEQNVKSMLDSGLKIARFFFTWAIIEPEIDQYDFSFTDKIFAACEKYGMLVTPTLMGASAPEYTDPDFEGDFYDFCKTRREKCVEKIVERYLNSPVLHSWILWNEPEYHVPLNEQMLIKFRNWLRVKYNNDIKKLTENYSNVMGVPTARNFDEVGTVLDDGTISIIGVTTADWSYASRIDWANFNEYCLIDILSSLNRAVKKVDTIHPTSVNVAGLIEHGPANGGRDLFHIGKNVDFLAASCHASWHAARFSVDRINQCVAMICDLVRSATTDKDECFYLSELQSGTNFFSGHRPMCPTANDITHWLYEAIGTGCKGIIYWLFNARTQGFEGLEWGLMNQQGNPSERSKASKAVSDIIAKNQRIFDNAKPCSYDGYIYNSYKSATLCGAERHTIEPRNAELLNPRNHEMINDAKCGAYILSRDAGFSVGFVNSDDFDGTLLNDAKFLLIPNAYSMSIDELQNILKYVKNGGTIVVDGLFAAKDEYGNKANSDTASLFCELFGGTLDDWSVNLNEFGFNAAALNLPAWFLKCIFENPSAKVLATDSENNATIIENQCGKGKAVYIGTLFFQNYFAKSGTQKEYRALLQELVGKCNRKYRLANPSESLTLKVLKSDNTDVLMLINDGADTVGEIICDEKSKFTDIVTNETLTATGSVAPIHIGANQVRILTFEN